MPVERSIQSVLRNAMQTKNAVELGGDEGDARLGGGAGEALLRAAQIARGAAILYEAVFGS